jgi:biopolymer transport protein ExbB
MSAFIDFLKNDWYFAIPLFLMSFAGIGLVLWRLFLNINGTTAMNEFLPVFQEKLEKEGLNKALAFCRGRTDIIPHRLFVAGLETHKQGMSAVRRAMANVIELEILPDLNFLLPSILAIAKVATMVGLFVTVISMIGTFTAIQQTRGGDVTASAGAIGLALFGTAMGLVCAIPLVFTHVLFKAWVAQFEVKMKSAASKLLLLLQAYKEKGGKDGSKQDGSGPQSASNPPSSPGIKPADQPSVARR